MKPHTAAKMPQDGFMWKVFRETIGQVTQTCSTAKLLNHKVKLFAFEGRKTEVFFNKSKLLLISTNQDKNTVIRLSKTMTKNTRC